MSASQQTIVQKSIEVSAAENHVNAPYSQKAMNRVDQAQQTISVELNTSASQTDFNSKLYTLSESSIINPNPNYYKSYEQEVRVKNKLQFETKVIDIFLANHHSK